MRVPNIKFETFSQNLYKKRYSLLVITIILASILSPLSANAQITDKIADLMIRGVLNFVRGVLGSLIALVGGWVDSVFSIPTTDVPVVRTSWEIVRNFANMFFVIILIIGAFATIFDVSTYDFRTMIGRFLVAALLINFSLVIGQIIIDWSQSLSNVFLQAIGSVGSRIAQGADIGGRFNEASLLASVAPTDTSLWLASIAVFANIILLSIILFSLVVLLFFSLVRVPILWALLILSPVAWVAYILPSTKKFNQDWWKYFLGWNMFLPIYLFFIYFGVLFLNNKEALGIVTSGTVVPGVNATLQTIFFYMLIGFFLIGGAKVAMSSSMAAGAGGVAAGIWARGRTAARFAGTRIPVFGGYSYRDIKEAGKERVAQAKREGVLGMFGEEQATRRQAALAEKFGVRDAKEKQLADDIGIYKKRYAAYDEQQLRDRMNQGALHERLAAREMLNQRGQLNGREAIDTYNLYSEAGSTAKARDFIRSLDLKRFAPGERQELYKSIAGADTLSRQKIASAMLESGDVNDAARIRELSTLYTDPQQQLEFFKRGKEAIKNLHSSQRRELFEQATGEIKAFVGELMNEEKELRVDTTRGINELNDIVTILENAPGARDANNQPTGQLLNRVGKLTDNARKYNAIASADVKLQYGLLKDSDNNALAPNQRIEALEQEIRKLDDQEFLRQSKIITGDNDASKAAVNLLTPGRIDHLTSRVGANRGQLDTLKPIFNQVRQTGNLQYIREKKGPTLSKTINRLKEITQQVEEAIRNRDPALNSIMRRARDAGKSEITNARKIVGEMRSLALPSANEGMKQAAQSGLDKAVEAFDRVVGADKQDKQPKELRQESQEKSKIILTPGAQFEIEKEENK